MAVGTLPFYFAETTKEQDPLHAPFLKLSCLGNKRTDFWFGNYTHFSLPDEVNVALFLPRAIYENEYISIYDINEAISVRHIQFYISILDLIYRYIMLDIFISFLGFSEHFRRILV
jgi:hypothetical protein